jgi:hypothetical protein
MNTLPAIPEKEVLFEPFPKQEEFIEAAFSGNFTFILFGGAIRGGKTFALLAVFIVLSRIFPGSRWAIVRKDLPTIKRNLYPSWEKIKPANFITSFPQNTHTVTFKNGSQIIFFPENDATDKDKNRWKGLEVNGIGFEELNECQQRSFFKAFERAGSYVIKGAKHQPKPLVLGTCNPTQGWVKDLVYTPWKEHTLRAGWHYIQSRIYDNLPLLAAQPDYLQSLKDNLDVYEYMVFVDGDWDVTLKTGGEFLRKFELKQHVKPVNYDLDKLMFVSIDSNVYPHIAITVWQIIEKGDGFVIRQVEELPAEDPENTASQAGMKIVKYFNEILYNQRVVLHGDKSTNNRNNIDDQKRSFFQIINETLQNNGFRTDDRLPSSMPPVTGVADFVNAIFEGKIKGLSIEIGEHCKASINDYIKTKTNSDGGILKVRIKHPTIDGATYEPHGHLTDSLKDFISQAFHKEYVAYLTRHKAMLPGGAVQVQRASVRKNIG